MKVLIFDAQFTPRPFRGLDRVMEFGYATIEYKNKDDDTFEDCTNNPVINNVEMVRINRYFPNTRSITFNQLSSGDKAIVARHGHYWNQSLFYKIANSYGCDTDVLRHWFHVYNMQSEIKTLDVVTPPPADSNKPNIAYEYPKVWLCLDEDVDDIITNLVKTHDVVFLRGNQKEKYLRSICPDVKIYTCDTKFPNTYRCNNHLKRAIVPPQRYNYNNTTLVGSSPNNNVVVGGGGEVKHWNRCAVGNVFFLHQEFVNTYWSNVLSSNEAWIAENISKSSTDADDVVVEEDSMNSSGISSMIEGINVKSKDLFTKASSTTTASTQTWATKMEVDDEETKLLEINAHEEYDDDETLKITEPEEFYSI